MLKEFSILQQQLGLATVNVQSKAYSIIKKHYYTLKWIFFSPRLSLHASMGLRKKICFFFLSVLVSIAVIRISLKQLRWALFCDNKENFFFCFRELLGNAASISAFFVPLCWRFWEMQEVIMLMAMKTFQ